MNLLSTYSPPQKIICTQSLPNPNVVKPRILLAKPPVPGIAFPRQNSHYSSPLIYARNDNSLQQSMSIQVYASPVENRTLSDSRTRNLSPEAYTVLDILNRIKNTTAFREISSINSSLKKSLEPNYQANPCPPLPVILQQEPQPLQNPEVKITHSKRSCNCSPKAATASPKNSLRSNFSFPKKTEESDPEADIKVYRIDLKAAVKEESNAVEILTVEEAKKRPDSPKKASPKRGSPCHSPKEKKVIFQRQGLNNNSLRSDQRSGINVSSHSEANFGDHLKQTKEEETILLSPGRRNSLQKQSYEEGGEKLKEVEQAKKSKFQIGKSTPTHSEKNFAQNQEGGADVMKLSKLKEVPPQFKIDKPSMAAKTDEIPFISMEKTTNETQDNSKLDFPKIPSFPDLTKKQGKTSIHSLLGKINECLSKTSTILNKTLEDSKSEAPINGEAVNISRNLPTPDPHSQKSEVQNLNSNASAIDSLIKKHQIVSEPDTLKITISPVKEMLFEPFQQAEFIDSVKVVTEEEERKSQIISPQKDAIRDHKNDYFKSINDHENLSAYAQPKDNFSPIMERSDEDKENNSPIINVYTNTSPKESKEIIVISVPQEILSNSHHENRKASDQPPDKNIETPYNKEAVGLMMQSPSNENESATKVIHYSVSPSSFYKSKANKPNEKKQGKSEKKISPTVSMEQIYHSEAKSNPKKEQPRNDIEKCKKAVLQVPSQGNQVQSSQNHQTSKLINKPEILKSVPQTINNEEKVSYSKLKQKTQKPMSRETSGRQTQILDEISNLDKEIASLEQDVQKEKIDQKVMKVYDNYKSYKRKLPSIEEKDELAKAHGLVDVPKNSMTKKKQPQIKEEIKVIPNRSSKNIEKNNQIVQERCNKLYQKGVEASQKKQKEIEENLKKIELVEKNQCTFKPEIISKKTNENILQNREITKKISLKTLKNYYESNRILQRTKSQNLHQKEPPGQTVKLNKSMSPLKNKVKKAKTTKSVAHSLKPWVSPRSTSSSKTRRMSREAVISRNQNVLGGVLETKAFNDPNLNGEIFDILKIFSGINDVLNLQKPPEKQDQTPTLPNPPSNLGLDKLRDLSPIKPRTIEEDGKSLNENSMNDTSSRNNLESRNSFDKVWSLLDQRHQQLLLKSQEITKKVERVFKENSIYAS